jgi:hypothetical protein
MKTKKTGERGNKTKNSALLITLILLCTISTVRAVEDRIFTTSGQILDGEEWGNVYIYNDDTIVDMLGGLVDGIATYDASTLNITDGSVSTLEALEFSTANVSGGYAHTLWAWDSAMVTLSGTGSVISLSARGDSGLANVYGGSVSGISTYDSGIVNLHGGLVSDYISAPSGTINIFGYDLIKMPSGGTYGFGYVAGYWHDNMAFTINLLSPETYSNVYLIPEPSSLVLFTFAGLLLRTNKKN